MTKGDLSMQKPTFKRLGVLLVLGLSCSFFLNACAVRVVRKVVEHASDSSSSQPSSNQSTVQKS